MICVENAAPFVFWDWNGTLLDDVDCCIYTMNSLLKKRGLHELKSKEEYRSVFSFPVRDYYERLGFDFSVEPFDALALEYIAAYNANAPLMSGLFDGAENALKAVKEAGIRQIILSASEQSALEEIVKFFGAADFFDDILGISDIYAVGKTDLAKEYMKRKGGVNAVVIGDTLHDYETARAINADCILIPNGHNGIDTLSTCGAYIAEGILDSLKFLLI